MQDWVYRYQAVPEHTAENTAVEISGDVLLLCDRHCRRLNIETFYLHEQILQAEKILASI